MFFLFFTLDVYFEAAYLKGVCNVLNHSYLQRPMMRDMLRLESFQRKEIKQPSTM